MLKTGISTDSLGGNKIMKTCERCGNKFEEYFVACPKCFLRGAKPPADDDHIQTQLVGKTSTEKRGSKNIPDKNFSFILCGKLCLVLSVLIVVFKIIGVVGIIGIIPVIVIYLTVFSKTPEKFKILLTAIVTAVFLFMMFVLNVLIGIGESTSGYGTYHRLPMILLIGFGIFLVPISVKLIVDNDKFNSPNHEIKEDEK